MKILCLGNNTQDTDTQTRHLAELDGMPCHGLLSELDQPFLELDFSQAGYYHTSVVDIQPGNLRYLINQFDKVILLDQPIDQWNHPNELNNTVAIMQSATTKVEFMNQHNIESSLFFQELVKTNKSFCIFPFIEFYSTHQHTMLCCRSAEPVTKLSEFKDFSSDPNLEKIRESMLQGHMLPTHCYDCYERESRGIVSARLSETPEWASKLGIKNLEELKKIKNPAFYDIRPSNKCNLTCRTCDPSLSHLIDREYKKLKINLQPANASPRKTSIRNDPVVWQHIDLNSIKKLLIAGGEPTIMPEFFQFLEKCISHNRTDFNIDVTTNGNKLSERLKKLIKHFSDISWVFSIDGYKNINHYIRHPSEWNNIVANWRYLKSQGHPVTVNTTISIYNINSLHLLFKWMDKEFPNTHVSCMIARAPKLINPLLFPDRDSVLDSLQQIQSTDTYKNNPFLSSTVDFLYEHFQKEHSVDQSLLEEFFQFNDLLDQNRTVQLQDHVPLLEKYRIAK
jgi:pyruvate-formate lyase-activating enzyme